MRTRALKEIGGLGPELAEDHSTTLMMNGFGWRGVHAYDAIAHGEGPPGIAECITQEFQWSRSLIILLLTELPKYWKKLPLRMKLQFLFTELWYPIFGLMFVVGSIMPIMAVISGKPWMAISFVDFMKYSIPTNLSILGVVWYLKQQGLFRPANAPIFSWEVMLFQMLRWPWVIYGTAMGIIVVITRKTPGFKVTPMGGTGNALLTWSLLYPYIAVILITSIPGILVREDNSAAGYHFFMIISTTIYTLLVFMMLVLHRSEENLKLMKVNHSPKFGIYDPERRFEGHTGFHIQQLYISWLHTDEDFFRENMESITNAGRIPFLTIEPWADTGSENALLEDILAGRYDHNMDAILTILAAYPGNMYISWGHEMDQDLTTRYHWSAKDPELFIKAYHYVADYFRKGLQDSISWVWAPVAKEGSGRYYPGDDYVDYIGFPIYSYPEWDRRFFGNIRSFDTWFNEKYANVKAFDKPLIIVEFGVTGSDDYRAFWMQQAFLSIQKTAAVDAIIFFHAQDTPGAWGSDIATPDWRSPESLITGLISELNQ